MKITDEIVAAAWDAFDEQNPSFEGMRAALKAAALAVPASPAGTEDEEETTDRNPKSWAAWKRRAEAAEETVKLQALRLAEISSDLAAALASPPAPAPAVVVKAEGQPPFEFDRYINGTLMAEGVTINRQTDVHEAMRAAARIASRGKNGEVPVLVLRSALVGAPAAPRALADGDEIEAIAKLITPGNFSHEREIGDVHAWCERIQKRIRALAALRRVEAAAESTYIHWRARALAAEAERDDLRETLEQIAQGSHLDENATLPERSAHWAFETIRCRKIAARALAKEHTDTGGEA